MPKYSVTTPNGEVFEVNAPEGASEQDAIRYVQQNYETLKQLQPSTAKEETKEDYTLGQKLTAGLKRSAEGIPAYMDEELSRVAGNILQQTGVIPPAPESTKFHSTTAEQAAIDAARKEHEALQQANIPTAIASGLLGYAPAMPFAANPWTGFTGGAITGAAENRYRGRAFGMEDTEDYETSGALFGGANLMLPASLPGALGKRMLTGAGMGGVLGGSQALVENQLTEGTPELYINPLIAAGIGAGVGGIVGGAFGHRGVATKQQEAKPEITPEMSREEIRARQLESDARAIEENARIERNVQEELAMREQYKQTMDMPVEGKPSVIESFKTRFGDKSPENAITETQASISKLERDIQARDDKIQSLYKDDPTDVNIRKMEAFNAEQTKQLQALKEDLALAKDTDTQIKARPRPESDSRNEVSKQGASLAAKKQFAGAVGYFIQQRERFAKNPNDAALADKVTYARENLHRQASRLGINDKDFGEIFAKAEANIRDGKIASHGLEIPTNKESLTRPATTEEIKATPDETTQQAHKTLEETVPDEVKEFELTKSYTDEVLEAIGSSLPEGKRVYISPTIPSHTAKIIDHVVKLFQFDKLDKKVLFVTDKEIPVPVSQLSKMGVYGQYMWRHPDYQVIFLNTERASMEHIKTIYPNAYKFAMNLARENPEVGHQIFQTYVALHEMGHMFTTNVVRSGRISTKDWNNLYTRYQKWYKANVPDGRVFPRTFPEEFYTSKLGESKVSPARMQQTLDYFGKFSEFLSEDFARYFLFDKVPTSGHTSGFRYIAEKLRDAFKYMVVSLRQVFNKDISSMKPVFIDDIINRILKDADRGAELWQNMTGTRQDVNDILYRHPMNEKQMAADAANLPDALPMQSPLPNKFSQYPDLPMSMRNMYGMLQLEHVYRHPLVSYAVNNIYAIEENIGRKFKNLWYGNVPFDPNKGLHITRLHSDKSMEGIFKKATDLDFARVRQAFAEGKDLFYSQTRQLHTAHLTPFQKEMFDTMSKYFKDLYKATIKLQDEAGIPPGKWLPFKKGWFPAPRRGNFVVRIYDPSGNASRTEFFVTKQEADAFTNKVHNDPLLVGYTTDPVTKLESQFGMLDEAFLSFLDNDVKLDPAAKTRIDELVTAFYGKPKGVSKHYVHRTNIPGAMGDTLYKTEKQLGAEWKRAIIMTHKEYMNSLSNMTIRRRLNPLVGPSSSLPITHPNLSKGLKVIVERHTNSVKNLIPKELEEGLNNLLNQALIKTGHGIGKQIGKIPSKTAKGIADSMEAWYPRGHTTAYNIGLANRAFYIMALTSRIAFSVAQVATSVTAIRHMFLYPNNGIVPNTFHALYASGSGFLRFAGLMRDAEFLKAVHKVAQDTESLSPQVLKEFQLLHKDVELPLEIASGEWLTQKADALSRLWVFSAMYDFYRLNGLKGTALIREARKATDSTMHRYDTKYRGAWSAKLGIVGEATVPLTTFLAGSVGNLHGDLKLFLQGLPKGEAKGAAAVIATGLVAMLISGVAGMPFVQEYEYMRKLLLEFDPSLKIPSAIEWSTGQNKLIEFGVGGYTGFDVGSGLRWNPIFSAMSEFGDRQPAMSDAISMFPGLKFAVDYAGNALTVIRHDTGLGRDISEAEYRNAKMKTLPAIIRAVVDAVEFNSGEREMVPNAIGAGVVPQTAQEELATFLGTRTIDKAKSDRQHRIQRESENRIKGMTSNAIRNLVDALQSSDLDPEDIAKQIDAVAELGWTNKQVDDAIKDEVMRRITEQKLRDTIGTPKGGPVNPTMTRARKLERQEQMQYQGEQ